MTVTRISTDIEVSKPSPSPFVIQRIPFYGGARQHIIQTIAFDENCIEESRLVDWPMVYILANENEAYVGQTTSVVNRMNQHGANPEKSAFTSCNLIYNDQFNHSVLDQYEHRLIEYMNADGKYVLTNKNSGLTEYNYYGKQEYSDMFEQLWEDLRSLELADKTIAELEESEVFKYSPYKALNFEQEFALKEILKAVAESLNNPHPIVIEGMPGTGKTVLAIFLLKMLKDNPEYEKLNVRIIEPVTSLRETLRKALSVVDGLSPADIISPSDLVKTDYGYEQGKQHNFDIVLVDEAHKLKRRTNLGTQFHNYDLVNQELGLPKEATQMDWVINQAKLPIFFYDPLQSIGPSCLGMENMKRSLGSALDHPITLESQMRVKGGKRYLNYIQEILNSKQDAPESFSDYEFILHDSFAGFIDSFENKLAQHDLTRMIAGYAWKWITQPKKCKDPRARDIVIDEIGLKWNRTYENWVVKGADNSEIAHEVGCIHSIQGYDLSYAYVIIGNDLIFDENRGFLVSNRASYFDRNGFATASDEELDQYIKNIYYVLLTRGIYGTHVYAANPRMREYLAKYIKTDVCG